MQAFFKKHWSNILFGVLIVLLLVPQTGKPIKIFVNRLIAISPSEIKESKREQVKDYSWILMDSKGKQVDFKDYKGKKIVLNFWATWCPPCIAEMPSLAALHTDFKDDVVFLFVSNEDHSVVQPFLDKKGFKLPVYSELTAPPEILSSRSLPTTFLIDEKGYIVMKKTGAADWNSESVRKLLTNE